jgi:hypothetical protein
VLEFYRSLSLTFGFIGVSSSGKLGFTRSLRRALSVLPMVRRSFALMLEPSRLAAGHPVDSRGYHNDRNDDEHDHQWIVHRGPPLSTTHSLPPLGPSETDLLESYPGHARRVMRHRRGRSNGGQRLTVRCNSAPEEGESERTPLPVHARMRRDRLGELPHE